MAWHNNVNFGNSMPTDDRKSVEMWSGAWNQNTTPQMMPASNLMGGAGYPEQWNSMQNWQQWAQWQQQYAQWHSQYGDKYAAQMAAMQSMAVASGTPPLPQSNVVPSPVPPPPDNPPPPPPHDNNLPLFGQNKSAPAVSAPAHAPLPASMITPAPLNTGNKYLASSNNTNNSGNIQNWSYSEKQHENPQSSINSEALKKLAEEERIFDIQFKKWEQEIETWTRENINHPDKQTYNEYKDKYETCRKQLLQRREQMQQKRRKLLEKAAANSENQMNLGRLASIDVKATGDSFTNHSSRQTYDYPPSQYSGQNLPPSDGASNSREQNNKNVEPQDRYDSYNKMNEGYKENSSNPAGFLPTKAASKTIPGLDLVAEDVGGKKQEVIEIPDDNAEKQEPDYSKISMGINSILGDKQIMNMLLEVVNKNDGKEKTHQQQSDGRNANSWVKNSNIMYQDQSHQFDKHGPFDRQQGQGPPQIQHMHVPQGQNKSRNNSLQHSNVDNMSQPYPDQQNYDSYSGQQNHRNPDHRQSYSDAPDRQYNQERMGYNQDRMPHHQDNIPQHNQDNMMLHNQERIPFNQRDQDPHNQAPMQRMGYNQDRMPPNNQRSLIKGRMPQNQYRMQQGNMHSNQPRNFPNRIMEDNILPEIPKERTPEPEPPLFTPAIIVDYEHEPLRLDVPNFIEPVISIDYEHTPTVNRDTQKIYETEFEETTPRTARGSSYNRDRRDSRSRDRDYRGHRSREREARGGRESDYRSSRDLEIRESRESTRPGDRRPPREDDRVPRPVPDPYDDRMRPIDSIDDRSRSNNRLRPSDRCDDRMRPTERIDDRMRPSYRMDDRMHLNDRNDDRMRQTDRIDDKMRPAERTDDRVRQSNRVDDRYASRRSDDRDRYGRREEPYSREPTRDRPREQNPYKLDRREVNNFSSESRDNDTRKRSVAADSTSSPADDEAKRPRMEPKPEVPKNIIMIDDIIELPGRELRPNKILIILRGAPGSGKSYLAKLIKDRESEHGGSARIMSIDDYFVQESETDEVDAATGKTVKKMVLNYEFDANSEKSYIAFLKKSIMKTITDGYFSFLIYDAVNESVEMFADIAEFARHNKFKVYVCAMETDAQCCFKQNVHGRCLEDIESVCARFEPTPAHYTVLDAATLLQSAAITEVEMEDAEDDDVTFVEETPPEVESSFTSKWEKMDDAAQLARLDGTSRPPRASHLTMGDYLQLDDWQPTQSRPGKKTVRWADIEERREQEKMRAIGFVVGQTNWDRMTDPTMGSSALTQTKYIERVKRK